MAFKKHLQINETKGYTIPTGRSLTIVKQVCKKSCGATCALMLALDQKHIVNDQIDKLPLSDDLIQWFFYSDLTNGSLLALHLKKEGFSPKLIKFDRNQTLGTQSLSKENDTVETKSFEDGDDILNAISSIIKKTNNSVIIAIDHPVIGGHWIIIDHIDEKEKKVYLREPYLGKAYIINKDEIAKLIYNSEDGDSVIEGGVQIIEGLYILNSLS